MGKDTASGEVRGEGKKGELTSETFRPYKGSSQKVAKLEPTNSQPSSISYRLTEKHIAVMAVDVQKIPSWMGYPEPSNTDSIPRISAEEVARLMGENGTDASSRIQLVDVRRSDLTVSVCSHYSRASLQRRL